MTTDVIEVWRDDRDLLWRWTYLGRDGTDLMAHRSFPTRRVAVEAAGIAYPGVPIRDRPEPPPGPAHPVRTAMIILALLVVLATAGIVSSGEANLEAWAALSDVDLRAKLCALPGVGAKVANCVMLFAYERLRAFPIDVWIERVLREKYFPRARKLTGRRLRAFSETYFGEHGGYAQQYLFHHARSASRHSGIDRDFSTPLRSARNDKQGVCKTSVWRNLSAPHFCKAICKPPRARRSFPTTERMSKYWSRRFCSKKRSTKSATS